MTGAPSKSRGALEVIVFDEARFRGSLMFTSAEVTLGNDPGVMIPLDDPSLSPCHATLHFDGESCTIENYDPLVGTLVNGEAVEHHDVSATDEIQLGRFRLRITVHRADATPAPLSVRSPTRSASSATKIPAKSPPGSARSASAAALKPTSPPPSLAAPAPSVVASVPPPLPMQPEPPRFVSAVPPPRPTSVSPTAARVPPADRRGAPSAPTALAVAPTLAPSPKLEPPTPQRRPTLSSVPAESPAPGRTATRPIGARPIEARIDAAPIEEVRDVSTERNAISPSAGGYSVPTTYTSARDEDDDDDAIFEPSFSLFEKLRAPGTSSSGRSAVEVVRFRHGCILKLQHLRRGEKLRLHGLRKPLGRCSGDGTFVFLHAALPGSVAINRQGKPFDDAAWRKGADQRGRISLDPATQVLFPLPSGEGVLVHLVPAAPPLAGFGLAPPPD